MAINLVSLVMDALTPDIIAKIALALGLDRGAAQKAISAAAPALLAALAGVAAKPSGARALYDAVSEQEPGVFANLAKTLDGSGHKDLAERGSGLLASLLGGSMQSQVANVVGKFAGLGEGTSSTLLGILAPFVLGTLRKQQTASGLDASGLANLLSSQKDNIVAAMPPGLARLLEGTNVLDSLGGRAAAAAQTTAPMAPRAPEKRSSNWLTWAIPILALLGLAWYFLTPRAPQPTAPTATTTTPPPATTTTEPPATTTTPPAATTTTEPPATTTTQPASLVVDGVDLGASVTSAIDGLKASLGGITDAATAQAALPKLQETTVALEKVSGMTGKLQAEQKSALAALITAALPVINPLIDKILAIPGVSAIVKPAIDGVRAQLDALAKA